MSEWSDMQVSGFLGWIHRLVMFITWPFRHWKYLLAFVILVFLGLFGYAYYHGVKWSDMYDWYKIKISNSAAAELKDKVQEAAVKAQDKVNQSIETIKEKAQDIAPKIVGTTGGEKKDEPVRFTAWNVAKFNKAKYQQQSGAAPKIKLKAPVFTPQERPTDEPAQVVIVSAPEAISQNPEPIVEKKKVAEQKPYYEGNIADLYTIRRDLDLTYLSESEKLQGKAEAMGPNSLYLENTYVYLYGIYTNSFNYDVEAAQLFLEKRLEKEVYCEVVAYTSQTQAATALCFVDGKLINREMVDAGLAENVALK